MYIQDWVARLDVFLQFNEEEVAAVLILRCSAA